MEKIRSNYPTVPVILMTVHGSEDIVAAALRKGAAIYVSKKLLKKDLSRTIKELVNLVRVDHQYQHLLKCMTISKASFLLENSPSLITPYCCVSVRS